MNTRLVAVQILKDVLVSGRSLTEAQKARLLSETASDAAFIQLLTYGVARWHERLQFWLTTLLKHPLKAKDKDIEILLLLGLYQLAYSTKPPHACVNETVAISRDLKKPWASKLVNAVLRGFLRKADELKHQADKNPATRYSLPEWLLTRLQKDFGDSFEQVAEALCNQAPMTLRINPLKQPVDGFKALLQQSGITLLQHMELQGAVTLSHPCDVSAIPGFSEGSCSVQDAAAQWCAPLLRLLPGQRILDACSAPGGKTAAIIEEEPLLENVTAVDIEATRQIKTKDTLQRLGLKAEVITADASNPALWWDGQPYDRILIDAPCSATGVIRRHPDIKLLRRDSDISSLATIQTTLLKNLWPLLKNDGLLLYATCSLLSAENKEIVEGFLDNTKNAVSIALPEINGTVVSGPGRQFLPVNGGHDGFYYALLRKTGESDS